MNRNIKDSRMQLPSIFAAFSATPFASAGAGTGFLPMKNTIGYAAEA